jgi:hypothetical protein
MIGQENSHGIYSSTLRFTSQESLRKSERSYLQDGDPQLWSLVYNQHEN